MVPTNTRTITRTWLSPLMAALLFTACSGDDGSSTGDSETDASTSGSESETDDDTTAGPTATTTTTGDSNSDSETTDSGESDSESSDTDTTTGDSDSNTDTDTETDSDTGVIPPDYDQLLVGLEEPYLHIYEGEGDGGVGHVTYFTLDTMGEDFMALPPEEQKKVSKIQSTVLASTELPPTLEYPGVEVVGTLVVEDDDGKRIQELTIKVPTDWNGSLVVAGAPGTRDEFSSEAVIVPWLLARGYAYVSGNKGMTNAGLDGNTTMLNQAHPTQHWGKMMIDLGLWAEERLAAAMHTDVDRVYAVGLSNGGYQVRRALELDHLRVEGGDERIFDGGLDWAGAYWPDELALDTDENGTVTPSEFAAAQHLVSTNEQAAQVIGWAYSPGSLNNAESYAQDPPFANAHPEMTAAGFDAASAPIWGAYNSTFDYLKDLGLTQFKGVGYYNFTAYIFRAELLGHGDNLSQDYSPYSDGGDNPPPFYSYLANAQDGGWTDESIEWALRNANTGVFSAPLISIFGERDGLLGLGANGQAYRDAVEAAGNPELHRLYVVQNAGHIDLHSDGFLDFDFNGSVGDENAGDTFAIIQPYSERAFDYLTKWVEADTPPPASTTVPTDPANDILDAGMIEFE